MAPNGAHVMSIHAQFAPYHLKSGDWNSRKEELGDLVVNVLSDYATNLKELIVGRQVITPLDLEKTYGLSGGHIHHGEMSLDQLFAFRPLIGWARYRRAGTECQSRDPQRLEAEELIQSPVGTKYL